MTRGSRPAKIEQWSERLERFERSGLTVVPWRGLQNNVYGISCGA